MSYTKNSEITLLSFLALMAAAATGFAATQNEVAQKQAEHQAEAMRQQRAEVKLAVPLTTAGAIDVMTLLADVQTQVGQGAREIQFRGVVLTADQVQNLLLNPDPNQNLLAEIAKQLPKDGIERKVTLRGAVDVRVQRQENGMLRVRIEDVNLGTLNADQRAILAKQLAALGFERVRIRGVDAGGNRVRIEFRGDKGLVRNEARDGGRSTARADRNEARQEDRQVNRREDRVERREKVERNEQIEPRERFERPERFDRPSLRHD